jgi:asparagine synthase (glutamine-hydrolysing)
MCGIIAVFSREPSLKIEPLIRRGLDRIVHRGPDGRGAVFGRVDKIVADASLEAPDWGLGHVRLAILDLSPLGGQPMPSRDRRVWITYNGEVYNYLELRDELTRLGHLFITGTDTEVILAAYQQWGAQCVERFNGMFAFVLADLRAGMVFAARDRLGVKPLYLWRGPSELVLVSEPKQLQAHPDFKPKAERAQVIDFLMDGVVGHEPDLCFFDGVHPLPPGRSLVWRLGETPGRDAARPYWDPKRPTRSISRPEAVEETAALFRDAVRVRLRSDVPVGSCLSGGVDSSSIVGVMSRELGCRVKTFSSCFDDPRFDERYYIDAVNRHNRSDSYQVFPAEDGFIEELRSLAYHQDEPFTSPSIYAQWRVMRAAREAGVPVLLDGQGGDETLCGYRKYALFRLKGLLARRRFVSAAARLVELLAFGDRGIFDIRAGQRYLPEALRRERARLAGLLTPEWRLFDQAVWAERMGRVSSVHERQLADLQNWSLPSLLRYEDRNSMAFSVETRLPFVDYRFVELCLALPEDYFFKRGRTKRVLVEGLRDALPREVQQRRTKMGFETPAEVWMRGRLGLHLEQIVRKSAALNDILDVRAAGDALALYRRGARTFSHQALFRVASLAAWVEGWATGALGDGPAL